MACCATEVPAISQVWDLGASVVAPVAEVDVPNTQLCCLRFSHRSPIAVCGTTTGAVLVVKLLGLDMSNLSVKEQEERLDQALRANVIKNEQAGV